MPKSKHRKKKQRRRTSKQSGPVFAKIPRLLKEDITKEEHKKFLVEAGRHYENEFSQSLEKLAQLVNESNPIHLLSVLAMHGLTSGVTESGKTYPRSPGSFYQPHAELVQALALQIPTEQLNSAPVLPEKVQEVWDCAISLGKAFSMSRLEQAAKTENREEMALLSLQERIRANTQMVRNWGYYSQVIRLSNDLFKPADALYMSSIGISATSIISAFQYLVEQFETRVNNHWQKMKDTIRAKNIQDTLAAYQKAWPDIEMGDMDSFVSKHEVPLEGVKSLLLSHSELRMAEAFIFAPKEISEAIGVDESALARGLSRLGYHFGDLNGENREHFLLSNPIWTRPLIQLSDGKFFCPLPIVFFGFLFQSLGSMLGDKEGKELSHRRASFLESTIENLINKSFPSYNCLKNLTWEHEGKTYETDLLVRIDSYALIIEAKSGSITEPALRGAPHRLKKHIQELFVEPSLQSKRLEEKLIAIKSGIEPDHELENKLPFNLSDIHQVIRMSVSLETFAAIQSNLTQLKEAGIVPQDLDVAPTMTLADIEIVFDILQGTSEKLHYLVRRSELEKGMKHFGDEMDLLGLYLGTGFNLGEIELGGQNLFLNQMSIAIDDYCNAIDHGIAGKRPKLKITNWWQDIKLRVERRMSSRWTEISTMLLNISYGDQRRMEKAFRKVTKNVKKNWRQKGHINSITLAPYAWRKDAVIFFAYRKRNKEFRHEYMENLAGRVFSGSHAQRCLVIGLNIDEPSEYPYSILGVMDRPI